MLRKIPGVIVAVAASLLATSATAERVSAPLGVGAVVISRCTLATASLFFGSYDPLGENALTPRDGSATLSVTCTKDAPVSVSLDGGRVPSDGRGLLRQMQMEAARLRYELFQDADRQTPWGTGEDARSLRGSGVADDSAQLTVYGRISPGQVVPAGDYADTVTAQVEF